METRGLNGYLSETYEAQLRMKLDYHALVSAYMVLFWRERVLVLTYGELDKQYDRFMTTLCEFLQVEVPAVGSAKVNVGTRSIAAVWLNRRANAPVACLLNHLVKARWITQGRHDAMARSWYAARKRMVHPLEKCLPVGKAPVALPTEWRARIETGCRASVGRLQKILNQDLAALGWPV